MSKYRLLTTGKETTADDPDRGVFYARCGFYTDDWDRVGTTSGRFRIPCCPECNAVGFQGTAGDWFESAQRWEAENPLERSGYVEFLTASINTCFRRFRDGVPAAFEEWRQKRRGTPCYWLGRPPCPKCGQEHGDKSCSVERDAELRLDHATNSLVAWALSCRTQNTGEWMAGLADRVNRYLDQVGDNDRYHFDGDGFSKTKGGTR